MNLKIWKKKKKKDFQIDISFKPPKTSNFFIYEDVRFYQTLGHIGGSFEQLHYMDSYFDI